MYMLKANSWQAPFVRLTVSGVGLTSGTIASNFGGEITQLINEWITDSISGSLKTQYEAGRLLLTVGKLPFFTGLRIFVFSGGTEVGSYSLPLYDGSARGTVPLTIVTNVVLRETSLCTYLQTSCSIVHNEKLAEVNGRGLGTAQRAEIIRARQQRDNVSALASYFYDACQYPWLFDSSGLTVRATDSYLPWASLLVEGSELASGLGNIVTSGYAAVQTHYREVYPGATIAQIDAALDNAGIADWFNPTFKTFTLRSSLNRMVQKPPLLLAMQSYPIVETFDLIGGYLTKVVARAVSADDTSALTSEYLVALKNAGFNTSKSRLVLGRTLFRDVIFRSYGVDLDVDFTQVISGSDRWADFAMRENLVVSSHPAYWTDVSLVENTLLGTDDSGRLVSVDLPSDMMTFADVLVNHRNLFVGLLLGWEHFVAMTFSASFKDFVFTSSTYRMRSFRPLLSAMGVTNAMMPEDVLGILRKL